MARAEVAGETVRCGQQQRLEEVDLEVVDQGAVAATACARTPAGPRTTSSALKLGIYLRAAARKKYFETEVASSRPPARQ